MGGAVHRTRPADGLYLTCDDSDWRLRCGIESLFLPQDEAAGLEAAVRAGTAVATVRVDGSGHAALLGVQPTDRRLCSRRRGGGAAPPGEVRSGGQNVPEKDLLMPLVVSVTVTSVKTTVIGGLHEGEKLAVTVSEKLALPFCTGKSPAAETSTLLTAFG